jgi:D-alanine-D-alanine ligase
MNKDNIILVAFDQEQHIGHTCAVGGQATASAVFRAAQELGYEPRYAAVNCRQIRLLEQIEAIRPCLIFNCIQSMAGHERLAHLIPSLLDAFRVPYTGPRADTVYRSANRLLTKEVLSAAGIRNPRWQSCEDILQSGLKLRAPLALKSIWREDSRLHDEAQVFYSERKLLRLVTRLKRAEAGEWIVEQHIPGREFIVSLLARGTGAEILPVAELAPPKSGRNHSVERQAADALGVCQYEFDDADSLVIAQLETIAYECWNHCTLGGYARVRLRVDQQGCPFVIDINGNPCIAPSSEFAAAASRKGIDYRRLIDRIMRQALESVHRVN